MQSFTCTALLGIPLGGFKLRAPGFHGLWLAFPHHCARSPPPFVGVPQPREDKSSRFAGRSPSYIMRQLYDIQHGVRNGQWAELMKPVVAGLSEGDMVAIAAYTASLAP